MQDLTSKATLAPELLVLAESHNLPKTAAACEHFIVKSFCNSHSSISTAELKWISQAACLRIIRALNESSQRVSNI